MGACGGADRAGAALARPAAHAYLGAWAGAATNRPCGAALGVRPNGPWVVQPHWHCPATQHPSPPQPAGTASSAASCPSAAAWAQQERLGASLPLATSPLPHPPSHKAWQPKRSTTAIALPVPNPPHQQRLDLERVAGEPLAAGAVLRGSHQHAAAAVGIHAHDRVISALPGVEGWGWGSRLRARRESLGRRQWRDGQHGSPCGHRPAQQAQRAGAMPAAAHL